MLYRAKIEVTLKPGHSDPEGSTTQHLLKELGYKIQNVNVGKVYSIQLEAKDIQDAQAIADEMAKRLLTNPTKDSYIIGLEEQK